MTENPESTSVDTPIVEALHIMHEGKFLHLPVTDKGKIFCYILNHKSYEDTNKYVFMIAEGDVVAVVDVIHVTHAAVATVSLVSLNFSLFSCF